MQIGRGHVLIFAGAEVQEADPDEGRGDVGSVAAGVHPDTTAHRAGHTHGPLQAGEAGRAGLAGQDGQGHGAPGGHRGAVDREVGEVAVQAQGQAGEPVVVDQQVRPLPHDQHRHPAPAHHQGVGDRPQIGGGRDLDEERRRPPTR